MTDLIKLGYAVFASEVGYGAITYLTRFKELGYVAAGIVGGVTLYGLSKWGETE